MSVNQIHLRKKIISVGKTSRGIILPKIWLDYLEKKHGNINFVALEVNGKLIIRPILKEAQRNKANKQA